ncbi:hypothetical protein [Dactylosporangium sp. NPDC049140]|uniref:hypothetical protein n=1 Tax=Dactylosporangium sp. NPDC049140 TaxID=3155647 RepID=UPI0033F9544B
MAVSAYVVEHATRLRLAGDWRGACAVANVVPDASLADLPHLAPDLLRWYLEREPRWRTYTGFRFGLGWHGAGWLVARMAYGEPQRIELRVEAAPPALELPRYQWDSGCTAELRTRCGGATRTPFFDPAGRRLEPDELGGAGPEGVTERALARHDAGRSADAWAEAGFDLRVRLFDPAWGPVRTSAAALAGDERARGREVDKALAGLRPVHLTLIEPRDHPVRLDWPGRGLVVEWPAGARPRATLVPMPTRKERAAGRDAVERAEFGRPVAEIPRIWPDRVRMPPEVAGLLDGTLSRADLHPLVQAALFPAAAPLRPPAPPPLPDRVRVYCGGAVHAIVMRDGALHVPHSPGEIDRERALAALGGRVQGCVAALDGWRDPAVRMPRQMRALRDRVLALVRHGDPDALAAALDRGLDPHLRDTLGATLLHLLPHFPGTGLVPRLLAAGLDPSVRERSNRTAAERAAAAERPDLVRALTA